MQDLFREGSHSIPQGYSGKACCKCKKWVIAEKTKSHRFLLEPGAAGVCSGLLTMAWQKLAGTRDTGEWNSFPVRLACAWLNRPESSAVVLGCNGSRSLNYLCAWCYFQLCDQSQNMEYPGLEGTHRDHRVEPLALHRQTLWSSCYDRPLAVPSFVGQDFSVVTDTFPGIWSNCSILGTQTNALFKPLRQTCTGI